MTPQAFESLVSRLENLAHERPTRYRVSAIGVAALGFLIVGIAVAIMLAGSATILMLIAATVVSGNILLLAAFGKYLIVLVVPAWAMVRGSFAMLVSRSIEPTGREVSREDAPKLFARLDDLRRRLDGPRVHAVLLTDDLGAAMVQHPRLGLFGWERNFLVLGLGLLSILSEKEALSVVAHEFGHLTGHHGRISGLIYRFRAAWERAESLSEQWRDWGSRLIAGLFRWYTPYFEAYTFVLARQHEYVADQGAVEMAGRESTANALIQVNIADLFADADYWPAMDRRAARDSEPPRNPTALWEHAFRDALNADRRAYLLSIALERRTDYLDTHPALSDRLKAIGVAPDPHAARHLAQPAVTAAQEWFGERLPEIQKEFDKDWRDAVAAQWSARHMHFRECAERLRTIEQLAEPNVEDQWERIQILAELHPDMDRMPFLETLLKAEPDHLAARYQRGCLLLARNDEAGIPDLEAVMAADPDSTLNACEAAWSFYQGRGSEKAEAYAERWRRRSDLLAAVAAEMEAVRSDAEVAAADLPDEVLDMIAANVKAHRRHVRRAYVLKRFAKVDPSFFDYILAVETRWIPFTKSGEALVTALAKEEYPFEIFIIHLGLWHYRRFRRQIKALGIEPLRLD